MSEKKYINRRKFLIRGGIGTLGVLAIGTYIFRNSLRRMVLEMAENLSPSYSGTGTEANLWFEITADNQIILHSPKVEMGQGTFTSFAQIIADELDVRLEQIQVIPAATETGIVDAMSTGGSLSVASLWMPLREMAATMREMLKIEAGKKLEVEPTVLNTKDGIILGGPRSMTYAEAAANVKDWDLPPTPELRAVGSYEFVGKPIKRVDLEAKVYGDPVFGMDMEMPDMLHATVIRPEYIGAKFKSANIEEIENLPGVIRTVQMDDWVGIIAETYAQALAAGRKLKVDWNIAKKWTEDEIREILQVGRGNKMITQKQGIALDPQQKEIDSIEFSSPIGAHAQIEPNGVVALVKDEKATIIISTQVIGVTQKQVSEALEIPLENVNVIPTYLGGGFGRRLNTNHAIQAAQMSKVVGKPVKYFFTRKEEFQHDTFRPPTHHIIRGKLNQDGMLDALEHHYASGDVAINSVIFPPIIHTILGTDVGAMRGGNIQYDKIPNHRAVQWHTKLPFATSWWRSLGLLANTFAIESFVDEMAIKAKKNPVQFRVAQISDEGQGKRLKAVIEKAGESYRDYPLEGKAMGIASSIDAGSPSAHVVEVSIENTTIKIHRVICVFDCGLAVNPDQVRAQCEGSVIMGISAAMHEKMTIKDGQLFPTIYGPYDMALMKHSPKELEVILIEGADIPYPVGEPPMGPIGAAIGNAVRRLTGKRLTDLPLSLI